MDITRKETLEDCLRIFQADMRRFGTESSGGMNAKPGLEVPHERALKEYRIVQKMLQELKEGIPIRENPAPSAWPPGRKERKILNVDNFIPHPEADQTKMIF